MFVSPWHNFPLSAKPSKNIKQKQGDDADRNEPYKHHNNLSTANFARDSRGTMLNAAQNRGEATLIAHQRFADVFEFAAVPGFAKIAAEFVLKKFANAPIMDVKFIGYWVVAQNLLGGAHN
jgi:hypothetical protein